MNVAGLRLRHAWISPENEMVPALYRTTWHAEFSASKRNHSASSITIMHITPCET